MALIKKASDAKTSTAPAAGATLRGKVEDDPSAGAAETSTQTAEAAAAAAAPSPAPAPAAASTSTAVATANPNAGAVVTSEGIQMMDVIAGTKNRYKVDWNTLDRVQANNGNFLDLGKNKESMGDTIQLRLLSWQDSWQISPGSNSPEAKDAVRYSDDGTTTTKGENINEYIAEMKEMFPKMKCDHRVVIAGELVGSAKDSRLQGSLIQLDLSKMSKAEFDKYQINTAFKIGRGLLTTDSATLMTMKTEVKTGRDNNSYTIVKFEPTL